MGTSALLFTTICVILASDIPVILVQDSCWYGATHYICCADVSVSTQGGMALISFTGARLQPVDLGVAPVSFKLLCVRVMSGRSSYVAAVI